MSLELDVGGEKCAVAAAMTKDPVAAHLTYMALYALQHRGVESSGIATEGKKGTSFKLHRGTGMVKDVYETEDLDEIASRNAIGHNRYSTDGSKKRHLQPVQDERIGFALATNGNLPLTHHLETFLDKNHVRIDKLNDSEKQALAIAQHIRNGHDLPDAVELSRLLFRGSYSTVAMHDGVIVAFRDPKGIRPLELGELPDGGYHVASETCALDTVHAINGRSIMPGEMVIITPSGVESRQLTEGEEKLDIFEFIYFARPDSSLYGQNVGMVRYRLGEQLAEEHAVLAENKGSLVVPVPETAVPIAEGFAKKLGLELTNSAVVKSSFVGRTFMLGSQELRNMYLDLKLSVIPDFVKGRDLIFVDDSIVRLNTSRVIVQKALAAGAKSVSFLSASPPIRYPDFYGIDTPRQKDLAAAVMTVEQIQAEIHARYLGYLPLSRMIAATNQPESRFNLSAFTGVYPIGIGHHKQKLFVPEDLSYLN